MVLQPSRGFVCCASVISHAGHQTAKKKVETKMERKIGKGKHKANTKQRISNTPSHKKSFLDVKNALLFIFQKISLQFRYSHGNR